MSGQPASAPVVVSPSASRGNLVDDLLIPTILFTSLGLFSWAIRGQSGYGAVPGCVFAGLAWAMAWYLLAREPTETKTRRYASGWAVLALVVGIGLSGMQGWAQWPNWIRGQFYLDWSTGEYVAIDPAVGYAWIFVAAVHWGGMGAVFLAWTGAQKPLSVRGWVARLACGAAGVAVAWLLVTLAPEWIYPHYAALGNYDPAQCPQCVRAMGDNRQALLWLGAYVGFLAFEAGRRDWCNVRLILVVGLGTGVAWMLLQYAWMIALPAAFEGANFNWWRGWESTGGGAIGLFYGIAFYVCNRPRPADHPESRVLPRSTNRNAEVLVGVHLALVVALGWATAQGIKGWLNLYFDIDQTHVGWLAPIVVFGTGLWGLVVYRNRLDPYQPGDGRDNGAHFFPVFLLVYAVHRELGLQVTGPLSNAVELAFFWYYVVLAALDVALVFWYRRRQRARGFTSL